MGVNAGVLKNNTRWTARRPEWACFNLGIRSWIISFQIQSGNPRFGSNTLEAGVIDTYVTPRLYGAFNVWDLDGPNAKVFTKTGDTTFELEITFDEAGSSDFTVCLSRIWYDDEWGKRWGAETQFKFDGTPAGFGQATEINYETGTYKFIYNSETHETTYQKIA